MAFVIGDLVCTVMILVGLIVLLFLLLLPKIIEWRRGEGDTRGLLIAVMLVLILVVGSYTTWLVLDYREWTENRELEYYLNVTAPDGAIGVVLMPVTINEDLQEALEVSPGGAIELVDTEYGKALRVVFQGNVTVRGKLEWREEFDEYHLTMLNDQHLPTSHIYWFNFDGDGATNGTVGVELSLVHTSIYKFESYKANLVLEEGWSEHKVLWDYQEWYYG